MTAWKTASIGELADTQLGKMLNKGKQSGKFAKPYLRTDNVHWGKFDLSEIKEMDILPGEEEKYLATKGDLLMCEGGASGRTAIWNEDYDISFQNHVHRIRPKDSREISAKYLLYFFEWFIKNGFASDLIKGVTISSLSQSGLRSIQVSYPPIDEQHKIVELLEDHLSRLDAAIADVKQVKIKATQFRRSLLQAAFTGNLDSLETRPVTELPDRWRWSIIGEVADIVRGVTYSKADTLSATDKDAVPLLRATNLEVDSIDFEDMVYVPKRVVKAQQFLQLGDIFLAASSGSISVVGKSAQVVKTNGETFGAFCAVIRPTNIHPKFLAYWVQSSEIRDYWSATAKGTNINNLKPSDISGSKIPIPPIEEQHKIVEILEDQLSRLDASVSLADAMEKQSSELRRSLLQAAFTCQLTKEVVSV